MSLSVDTRRSTPRASKRARALGLSVAASAVAALGCGSDGSGSSLGGSGYVVAVLTFTQDETTGYLGVVDEILPDTEIDITQTAIEVTGGTAVWATPDGAILVSDNENRLLRRLKPENGTLVDDGRLSYANQASGNLYGSTHVRFDESGQAFLNFAGSDQRVVVIDYVSMEIVGSFDFPEIVKDGWTIYTGYDTIYAEGHLYFALGWLDSDAGDQLPIVGLVTIDVQSGEVIVDELEGCHGLDRLVLADDGYIYGATGYASSWIYAAYGNGVNSCARRVGAGATAWDASYAFDLDDAVSGKTPWAVGVSGTAGHVWLAAIHPDFDPTNLEYTTLYTARDAYLWQRVNLADPEEPVVTSNRAVTGPDIMPSTVEGRTFIMEVGENNDKTTLLDATGDDLVEYARFNGYMTGFVKLGEQP